MQELFETREPSGQSALGLLLRYLPGYLLSVYLQLIGDEHNSARYIVHDIYIAMCDLAFRTDSRSETIHSNALLAVTLLYDKYVNRTVTKAGDFQGCGPCYKVLYFKRL